MSNAISKDDIGDIRFLKEEMICKVLSYQGEVFGVELPIVVELEVRNATRC